MKAHQAAIEAVKKGDSVVTAGGIVGKVTKVDDAIVEVEIAPSVQGPRRQGDAGRGDPPGTAKPAND